MNDDDIAHPLDEEEDEPTRPIRRTPWPAPVAYSPLLKPSLLVLAISFTVTFLSAVMSSNAQPNSSVERISATVNYASAIVMLVAFSCILIAYRIPFLRKLKVSRPPFLAWGFLNLVYANLVLLALVWLGVFLLGPASPFSTSFITAFRILFIALLATICTWHDGFVRAYAMGALITITLTSIELPSFSLPLFRASPSTVAGIYITLSALIGLACASYVKALLRYRTWDD